METLRDSLVGGLLRWGEDDTEPALLGLDEMWGTSDRSNTLLLLSKSGVAELRLKDAKLASSLSPEVGWDSPTSDLFSSTTLTFVLGVAFSTPEPLFTKTFSLLCFLPSIILFEAATLLCLLKVDPAFLMPLLVPPAEWVTDLELSVWD